jgi:aldehyde:ferredoxin oxidoreductase
MYSGNVLVVHLDDGRLEERFLEDGTVEDRLGGALLGLGLYEEHREGDPVVLASGPLTGGLVPTASTASLTARSPLTGGVTHASVTNHAGAELKYAGYDAIVLTGRSPEPVYLWVHDEQAELLPATELWGADAFTVTDAVRDRQGDERVQVIAAGPACAAGSLASSLTVNYWASTDRAAIGALFGRKRLLAVAARGMGELEPADIDGFGPAVLAMMEGLASRPKVEGFKWDGHRLDPAREAIAPLVHRERACFYCASRGRPYLMLDEDPGLLGQTAKRAPGVLVADLLPLGDLVASGMDGLTIGEVTRSAYRLGLDPSRVSSAVRDTGARDLDAVEVQLGAMVRGELAPEPGEPMVGWDLGDESGGHRAFVELGAFTPANPPLVPTVGLDGAERLLELQGLAYILGLCPAGAVGAGIDAAAIAGVVEAATGLGLSAEDLDGLSRRLVRETVAMGPGSLPDGAAQLRGRFA